MEYRRLWIAFALVIVGSFTVLGFFGREIYREAPPVPERVVTTDGRVLFTGDEIHDGQNVWQSTGGQELGTVWGHGAYVAPDWSADWLHREAVYLLDAWARSEHGLPFDQLDAEPQAALQARLQERLRANTYDPATGDLVVSRTTGGGHRAVADHYRSSSATIRPRRAARGLRHAAGTVADAERRDELTAFFFWTAWACVTERPGQSITYTNNWPPEHLVGNRPDRRLILWTGFSVILLLAGIGALAWYYAATRRKTSTRGHCRIAIPCSACNRRRR